MMGADEAGTLSALKHHRETVFDPAVAEHKGRVFKLIGDGTLVEFGSVVDAVNCALAIQRAVRARGRRAGGITLRIGINLGDVIIEGDDMYGDGVNVAARLEPLAEPGGVCVAAIVNESIGNRIDVAFRDGGEVSVKNIARPVRVWKWHPGPRRGSGGRPGAGRGASARPNPSSRRSPSCRSTTCRATPSRSISPTASPRTSSPICPRSSGLLVIARNSSFTYKGKSVDIRTVGRELGVAQGARRLDPPRRQPHQDHRAADRRGDRRAYLGGALRPRSHRYLRGPGRSHPPDRRCAQGAIDDGRGGTDRGDADRKSRGARIVPKRPGTCAVAEHQRPVWKRRPILRAAPSHSTRAMPRPMRWLGLAHIIDFTNRWSESPAKPPRVGDDFAAKAIAADPNEPLAYVAISVSAQFEEISTRRERPSKRRWNSAPTASGAQPPGHAGGVFRRPRGGDSHSGAGHAASIPASASSTCISSERPTF